MRLNGCNIASGFLSLSLMMAGAITARGQAVIQGSVTLPRPNVADAHPPRYAAQAGEAVPADPPAAVVYLEGQFPAEATNAPPGTNQVLQQGMQFHPALLPVRVGTTVAFPNGDDFYHNVFSYSKAKRFDLGRYRKDDKPEVQVFDKPGVVKLYCEIHEHMRGVILVLDTPYFTRTGTNGTYRLDNLPPGKYLLNAWVDENQVETKQVELENGKILHVDFNPK